MTLQARKLQNYVEQFKNSQDYQELESIARSKVVKTLLDNKKLLQNALVSVIVALRNDPDRYLSIDQIGSDIQRIKAMGVDHIVFGYNFVPMGRDIAKMIDVSKELSKFAR